MPRQSVLQRVVQAVPFSLFSLFVLWLFAAVTAIYVKSELLDYMVAGRALGRIEIAALTAIDPSRSYLFSFFEQLSFYRSDLLLGFFILPLIGWGLLYWLPRQWRLFCVVTVTFSVVVFLCLQLLGFKLVGQFQSWELWYESIRWGVRHLDVARKYLGAALFLQLGGALLVLYLLALLVKRWWQGSSRQSFFVGALAWISCLTLFVMTAIAWATPMHATSYHRSAFLICFEAFFGLGEVDVSKYDELGLDDVLAAWREVTNTPAPKPLPDHFAAAQDYDVIYFILETAPSRCLDVSGDMEDLPNLKRLRERSWVAPNHVTTYPFTSFALYSMITSWYPTDIRYQVSGPGPGVPGVMRTLGDAGYATAAYLPIDDENFHHEVGISRIVFPKNPDGSGVNLGQAGDFPEQINSDRVALELMKKDLGGWIRENRRYAVMYLPQVGHAPWHEVGAGTASSDVVSRGRALIGLQDQWLGELLDFLEEAGRLERTLIVVTGDHGIRTRMEDPAFVGGMIDPYSFRVPCLLFAPSVLQETAEIPWMTSHIDLTPSILDLLGAVKGRDLELGAPIWDERLEQRTTLFWADKYLGVDGFHENGTYYMWHYISDMLYENTAFDFKDLQPVASGSPVRDYATGKIIDARALQHRIGALNNQGN